MMKSKNKKLRKIIVDGEDYMWLYDGDLKVWKDKKIIYEEGWGSSSKYSNVSYNLMDGVMSPRVVAKVIRLVNMTEPLVSNEDILSKIRTIEPSILMYDRHVSFEDKRTEMLWSRFMDSFLDLKEHLNFEEAMNESSSLSKSEVNE